ncbi:MAG: LapA family protein [Bacteroidetes bacterium]|nr:LapA family protein [Bacteroidota bacterium]
MKKKTIDLVINIFMGISALAIIAGILLKHYNFPEEGNIVFLSGMLLYIFLTSLDSRRLNDEIKRLQKKIKDEGVDSVKED